MKIPITRPGIPATHLNVNVMSESKTQLGEQRPVAFILPGGPGADHTAYLSYACLKEVTDLVFYDPRGCGASDKGEAKNYTMDNYIDDIESIRQHLSIDKMILIGKSYGSMCALGYALRYPHAVQKLVLAAGAPSYRFLETAKKNLLRLGSAEQIKVCEKLWAGSFKSKDEVHDYFDIMSTLYSVKARTQKNSFNLGKKTKMFSFEALNEGFRHSFWWFDYEDKLQQVLCPTLVLVGREDWVNDAKHGEQMALSIPYSQLHVFEKSGHAMESDVPEEYFQVIADFIQR